MLAMRPNDDPAIVIIPDIRDGNMDEWLASLPDDKPPVDLPVSAAELVAEMRREEGCDLSPNVD